jgi:hypothetical protein
MALGSTQPLTEMSTRCISWGKGGRCVRLTTLPPSCAVVMKSGNLNFLEPSGPLQACNGTALPSSLPLIVRWSGIWSELFSKAKFWRRRRESNMTAHYTTQTNDMHLFMHFTVLCCIITSQCTVLKNIKWPLMLLLKHRWSWRFLLRFRDVKWEAISLLP